MRTSYSALGTYKQCPQKYKFQEIDHIRVPKSWEARFGTLIHSTLRFMFKSDPLYPTLDEVVAHFRESWPVREAFEEESRHDSRKRVLTPEEEKLFFEEGVRMLKRFYEKNAPWNFHVLDLESRFEVMLTDEKTGETHILAGIIDRIDKTPDGKYEIIDYKTSKRMPSQEILDRDLQLSLYSLGLQKRWPHLIAEDIVMSLYFLKHGEKLTTRASQEKTEATKTHVLETIREIQGRMRSGKDFEPTPSALCDWCGFRPLCPAWKHLYRKSEEPATTVDEIPTVIHEYFELKKENRANDDRLEKLQEEIKEYMAREGLTRVFGDDGTISKKTQQRYEYDFEKVKVILAPLGKWEEILKADETKLKKIMGEIPQDAREAVESARRVSKEYVVLTASAKTIEAEPL